MKKKRYIQLWVSLVLLLPILIACITDKEVDISILPEDTPFEVTFGSFTSEIKSVTTRVNADKELGDVTNLRILVFNESGNFLYSRQAELKSQTSAPSGDGAYLPDSKKDGIHQVYTYSANLLSSTKKRIIHFIANHDWVDYPQDHFLVGQSEGELIPALTTNKTEFWRRVEFIKLNEDSLQGKVVKLLRNQAKISIEYTGTDPFIISNAWVYNGYDKGTVAPFFFNNDLSYSFPHQPDVPTLPMGLTPIKLDFTNGNNELEVELFEHLNEGTDPLFIIIKSLGRGFYKIDLKKIDNHTGITSLYDVVRNYWYKIEINSVTREGYNSAEEAAINPAGNNLLASVELEKYPSISNGKHSLSVGEIEAVYTKIPAVFKTTIKYSEGAENVKVSGLWEQNITDEYIESVGYSIPGSPGQGQKEGEFTIKFKKIPKDETVKLQMAVVASPQEGSTDIITRTITITLRPPYQFNAELTSARLEEGKEITIWFDIPQTIPALLFPFDVLIQTKELTPIPGQNLSYEFQDGKYYIKYLVTEANSGKRVDLKFKQNIDESTEKITLLSNYFEDGTVNL